MHSFIKKYFMAILVLLVSCSGGSSSDATAQKQDKSASPQEKTIETSITSTQISDRVRLMVQTIPDATLQFKTVTGTIEPATVTANSRGYAETIAAMPEGEQTITVVVTKDLKTAETPYKFTVKKADELMIVPVTAEGAADIGKGSLQLNHEGITQSWANFQNNFSMNKKTCEISFDAQMTSGQQLEIAGKTYPFVSGVASGIRINLKPFMEDLERDDVKEYNSYPISIPMTVRTTEGTKTGDLKLSREAVSIFVRAIDQGPVLFDNETSEPGRNLSLLVLPPDGSHDKWSDLALYGTKLKQMDLIGVMKAQSYSAGKCYYEGDQGTKKDVELLMHDLVGYVYDRRTGKQLGNKLFRAKNLGCEEFIKIFDGNQYFEADQYAVTTWMESFVDKDYEAKAKELAKKQEEQQTATVEESKPLPIDVETAPQKTDALKTFFSFVGINYGDKTDVLFKQLGTPAKTVKNDGSEYSSDTYYFGSEQDLEFPVEVAIHPKTDKVEKITIRGIPGVSFLRSRGLADNNLTYINQTVTAILGALGKPKESESSVEYEFEKEDGHSVQINFECHDFWDNQCRNLVVKWNSWLY